MQAALLATAIATASIVDRCNHTHAVALLYGRHTLVESRAPIAPWPDSPPRLPPAPRSTFGAAATAYGCAAPPPGLTLDGGVVVYHGVHIAVDPVEGARHVREGGNELWAATANCVVGLTTRLRGCVPGFDIAALAATDTHLYVLDRTTGDVAGFAHATPPNRRLRLAAGHHGAAGRRPVTALYGPVRATQPLPAEHPRPTSLAADAGTITLGYASGACRRSPAPPLGPERVHAHWAPALCEPDEAQPPCSFAQYGPACRARTACPRAAPNTAAADTVCKVDPPAAATPAGRHQRTPECPGGTGWFEPGRPVVCRPVPDCERYNEDHNVCEHVPRKRRQVQPPAPPPLVCPAPALAAPDGPAAAPAAAACPGSEYRDRGVCVLCRECGSGLYRVSACTATADVVCADCPPGTYQPDNYHSNDRCIPTNGCAGATAHRDGSCDAAPIVLIHGLWVPFAAYALAAAQFR